MADVAVSSNQNYLPVQAYFNLDGTFNTFIGQGQPFQITAPVAVGINNTTVNATVYPTFTSVTSGVVTTLSITSSALSFNPSTGILNATGFNGALSGTATTATNIAGGIASQIPYQIANGQTAFIANGVNGQVLTSNGTSVPSWQNATSNINITDDTSSLTTEYVTLARVTTGSISTLYTSSSKLSYVSQTGTLSATTFNGALASSNLTGTTLPSSIVSSSLTSVGTIVTGVWNGTAISNTYLSNSAITINGTSTSLGGSINVGTVTSITATAGTGISITGSPITSSGTLNITNTAPDQTVSLTNGTGISVTGTYPNFTITNTSPSSGGTVTSVSATAGTGISITGSPITTSGTLNITNTAPDQVVSLTGSGSTTVTGTYPSFTISSTAGATVAGSNTQVQYNNSGAFGANANFTYTGNDVNIPFGPSNSATSAAKIALFLSLIN
jgi:hypothetical protein